MQAIRLVAYGDAVDGIDVHAVDEPAAPGHGEVLVQVRYAPVNVNDLMVVWGIYDWKPEPPASLGNEGAPALHGLDVRLALDGVGGTSAGRLAGLLGSGGKLVAYGAASHAPMDISAQHLIFKRLTVHGFFEGHPDNAARVGTVLAGLTDLLRPGGIRQPVAAVYPAREAKAAVAHAVKGGKVLLAFGTDGAP